MMSLDDREWKPIPIISLFDRFEPGKGKGLNHLEQVTHGITYVGATNRNNGVLCFVRVDDSSRKMIQDGNCIGFIKNGDGSAGYAIYKREPFISTSDVIFGYADWLNPYTGLFFVAAQDMIEHKYSHGYKRNAQHLKGDRVMLPVNDDGQPDYQFMEDYIRELMDTKKKQYRGYVKQRLAELCSVPDNQMVDWKSLIESHDWKPFYVVSIFPENERGKRLKKADHVQGNVPYASSTGDNNGIDGFIEASEGTRVFNDCISLANSGSVGSAFYEPFEFVASDHVTHLKKDGMSKYQYLFLTCLLKQQSGNFNFNREINDARLKKMQIMLPVTDDGQPDYDFMEEFGRKMMSNKYNQYLAFLAMSDTIKA